MKYIEVKFKIKEEETDTENFISNVIAAQETLGLKDESEVFNKEKLLSLGFNFNASTKGFSLQKDFTLEELIHLAFEVEELHNHVLIHGYITLKVHEGSLYFWDKALVYEGIDSFEYCLKHHNVFTVGELNVVTKSDCIHDDLLKLAKLAFRFSQPSLSFITQNLLWDKKQGYKIDKRLIENEKEYMNIEEIINYK